MEDNNIDLISTTEAAQMLTVSIQTIGQMIWDGRLQATQLGNATSPWRINKASVVKYIKQAS